MKLHASTSKEVLWERVKGFEQNQSRIPTVFETKIKCYLLHTFCLDQMLLAVHSFDYCLLNLTRYQLTYHSWNQKFRYFFYLLNPSVGPKQVSVLLVEGTEFEIDIKVEECWKNKSLSFNSLYVPL